MFVISLRCSFKTTNCICILACKLAG
uniref:Uncharacterized protein n=1 Tax=Anguilla anguilla TaxID=7936 RepID=A0A0E9TAR9_ANGAN